MLQEKNIVIAPIFDQAAPGVWVNFVEIRGSRFENTDIRYSSVERAAAMKEYQDTWRRNKNNFAFGAYDGDKMIGFAQGLFKYKGGILDSLYVLPEYQRSRIGTRLLSNAEDVSRLVSKRIIVHALPMSETFFAKNKFQGYGDFNWCEMIKPLATGGRSVRVVPVFRSTPMVTGACSAICSDYDPNRVNDMHNPTFIFVGSNGDIFGYVDDTGTHIKRVGLDALITNCLNRAYNEFLTVNNRGR